MAKVIQMFFNDPSFKFEKQESIHEQKMYLTVSSKWFTFESIRKEVLSRTIINILIQFHRMEI
jgi:hypothetical protein